MATGIESDRAIGPIVHRMRRWVRNAVSRVGGSIGPENRRNLDPITVNYAAWREMRRHVREWPGFWEAPNRLEVLVSPEDWEDYWGIDAGRKEQSVATYVRARAAEKGYWIAGQPKVTVVEDVAMSIGEVEVECQFVESPDGTPPRPASQLSPRTSRRDPAPRPSVRTDGVRADEVPPQRDVDSWEEVHEAPDAEPGPETMAFSPAEQTVRFVSPDDAGKVLLLGKDGLKITLHSGDCVGAVTPEDVVPEEVNVRLAAREFPYAEAKHFSIGVAGGRWSIVNHASTGTKVVSRDGRRLMLLQPDPYPLSAGDVVYLGPFGPLRFEFA